MRRILVSVAALVGLGCIQAQQPAPQPPVSNGQTIENWREDLNFFAAILRGTPIPGEKTLPGQKDFEKLYPHFANDLNQLQTELPNLRNGAIYWRLAKIVAGAQIAHNSIFPDDPQQLPLAFEWLEDGLVITAASAEFKSTVGARVLTIGKMSTTDFLDAVSPYLAFETEGWRRVLASFAIRRRALLELMNFVHDDKVDFTLEGSTGTVSLNVPFGSGQTPLVFLTEALGTPAFLVNKHPEQTYYWRELLTDSQTLYVQYRRCADDPKIKFSDFVAQTLAAIDQSKARRVIVDLRFNQGGNSSLLHPLTAGLASRRKAIGVPLVLIGPGTFSSGVWAARELREKATARLFGATTGGQFGGYGEAPSRRLPHSQLGMQWTIKYFPSPEPVTPDVKVAHLSTDVRGGRDRVLEAAIAFTDDSRH